MTAPASHANKLRHLDVPPIEIAARESEVVAASMKLVAWVTGNLTRQVNVEAALRPTGVRLLEDLADALSELSEAHSRQLS